VSSSSTKIYEQFRLKNYKRLFDLMDTDKDGIISEKAISIQGLDDK